MIERVAKVWCDCYGRSHKDAIQFHTRAEAVIKAMREPTEKMIEAAFGKHENPNPYRTAWYAMIDAALKE